MKTVLANIYTRFSTTLVNEDRTEKRPWEGAQRFTELRFEPVLACGEDEYIKDLDQKHGSISYSRRASCISESAHIIGRKSISSKAEAAPSSRTFSISTSDAHTGPSTAASLFTNDCCQIEGRGKQSTASIYRTLSHEEEYQFRHFSFDSPSSSKIGTSSNELVPGHISWNPLAMPKDDTSKKVTEPQTIGEESAIPRRPSILPALLAIDQNVSERGEKQRPELPHSKTLS